MILGEFLTKLGVITDKKEVRAFTGALRDMTSTAFTSFLGITGLSLGVGKMVSDLLEASNSLGIFHAETGESTDKLQRWQQAGEQFGLSAGVVRSSILGLSDSMARLKATGDTGVAMAFGRLQVNPYSGGPFEMIEALRQAYRRAADPSQFRLWASQLGVAPEMTRLFDLSDKDFSHAMNMAPMLSNEDQRAMTELQAELARFSTTVRMEFVPAIKLWLPYLEDLAKWTASTLGNAGNNWKAVTNYANEESPGVGHGPVAFYVGVTDMAYRWAQGLNRWQPGGHEELQTSGAVALFLARFEKAVELLANDGRQPGVRIEQHFHDVNDASGVSEAGKEGARELEHAAKALGGGGK